MDNKNNIEITQSDLAFLKLASKLAFDNIDNGGGPFGAIIVKDGTIISKGVNSVTKNNDPTAHAEVNAIRAACAATNNFKLDGCVVYSSCEPCPMCLSALYWAGVSRIYYGNTKADAAAIDFDDNFIYEEIDKPAAFRSIPCIHIPDTDAIMSFKKWASKDDKVKY
ncbi:MAG: nucleoside deaminase [Muribaculaceae bacterium]|jgi:guanine deaminase|nr:nucleoside deaminase [Muribaculaceae bacterium]